MMFGALCSFAFGLLLVRGIVNEAAPEHLCTGLCGPSLSPLLGNYLALQLLGCRVSARVTS